MLCVTSGVFALNNVCFSQLMFNRGHKSCHCFPHVCSTANLLLNWPGRLQQRLYTGEDQNIMARSKWRFVVAKAMLGSFFPYIKCYHNGITPKCSILCCSEAVAWESVVSLFPSCTAVSSSVCCAISMGLAFVLS